MKKEYMREGGRARYTHTYTHTHRHTDIQTHSVAGAVGCTPTGQNVSTTQSAAATTANVRPAAIANDGSVVTTAPDSHTPMPMPMQLP